MARACGEPENCRLLLFSSPNRMNDFRVNKKPEDCFGPLVRIILATKKAGILDCENKCNDVTKASVKRPTRVVALCIIVPK